MKPAAPFVWREVHWPRPFDTASATMLLRRLAADAHRGVIAFDTIVREGRIHHLVGTSGSQIREISHLIESHATGTALEKPVDPRPTFPVAGRLTLRNGSVGLYVDRVEAATHSLLAALAEARFRGEELMMHVVLGPGRPPREARALIDPTQGIVDALVRGTRRPSSDVTARLRAKASENGFRAWIAVAASANTEGRRRTLMAGVLAALRTMQAPGTSLDFARVSGATLNRLNPSGWMHLTTFEALGALGWPIGTERLPGLPDPHPRQLAWRAPDHETERVFGVTTAPGKSVEVGISIEDALFHTVVTGATGSGKSTLLKSLIAADMNAGRSVVLVDMKGDLVSEVCALVPPERIEHVVLLDPTQPRPVGYNPLHVPGTSPELIADGALKLFRSLFPHAFGPRTADLFHAALLTLAHTPRSTLPDLLRLFSDRPYREHLIAAAPSEIGLRDFWIEFDGLSPNQQAQHIAPLTSRLRQYLLRPGLRRVFGQHEPRFELGTIFTKPRIFLVPLNSGIVGVDAGRLLGSALVSTLWQLTLGRAAVPPTARTPVSIVIDEAQEFVRALGADLGDALARSRALGVGWTIAYQFRDAMPTELVNAIDANARNKIMMEGGPKDAKAHAAMSPELSPEDFSSLKPYHAYARLMRRGAARPFVSIKTNPAPPNVSDPDDVRQRSTRRWGGSPDSSQTPSSAATAAPTDDPTAIGRRRRS